MDTSDPNLLRAEFNTRSHGRSPPPILPEQAVEKLEFRGEDSEECNKFISAVLKYAFAEGKQRDDEWVADFAGTCFKGDALGWWMGLRPRIQGSWTLLRHAMTQKYRPSFYGRSGEEAEKFVQLVYERAMDAGRQEDNQWIAEFVPTCFKGEALRWFSSLDTTVRNDWGLLQEAIFRRFPSDDINALSRVISMLAVARPPANPAKPLQRGRIRVEYWGGYGLQVFYVSHSFGRYGDVICTRSKASALQVDCDPTYDGLQDIVIPDIQTGLYDLLAMKDYDLCEDDLSFHITLCAVHSETWFTSCKVVDGLEELHIRLWKIVNGSASASSERATIVPTTKHGRMYVSEVSETDGRLVFSYKASAGSLVFEPL